MTFLAALNPEVAPLVGYALSMLGAALVKKLSKSNNKTVHKWLAPTAAVAVGVGYEAVTGSNLDLGAITAGTGIGGSAVYAHTIYKQIIRPIFKKEN